MFTEDRSNTSNTSEETLKMIRKTLRTNSLGQIERTQFDGTYPHVFVTFGASVSDFIFHFYFFALHRTC